MNLVIGSSSVKTVADRHTDTDILLIITSSSDELFNGVNTDNLK